MGVLHFLLGFVVGITLFKIISLLTSAAGIISVDHESGLCRVFISSEDLSNRSCKKAVFKVEHDAVIRDDNNDYNE